MKFKGALFNLRKITPKNGAFELHDWKIEPREDRIVFKKGDYSRSIQLSELFRQRAAALRVGELSVGWRASQEFLVAVVDFPSGEWLSLFFEREKEE